MIRQARPKINYRSLFDTMIEGLAYCQIIFDDEKQPVDFIFLEVNKNYEELTGMRDVVGKKVTDLIPGIRVSNPEMFETYGRVSITGRPEKMELYVKPLARWFLISVYSPKTGYFTAVFQNITGQKQIEKNLDDAKIAARNVFSDLNADKKKLDAAKAKDEAILRSIADGLIAVDKAGKIVLVNQSFENILGWEAKEVYGKALSEVIPMLDTKGRLIPNQQRLETKALTAGAAATTITITANYERKNGTTFPVEVSASPIIIGTELIGAVEVFRDITKEKEVDRAKTEFVSLASHQLKTPPTAIKLLTERLLSGKTGPLTAKQAEYITDVQSSNQRMIELVNALLNVSRIELGGFAIQLSKKNICEVISSALHDLKPALDKKQLRLEQQQPEDSLLLMIDEPLFRIIINNLVTNAINYTAQGGMIRVEIKETKNGETLGGTTLKENGFVIIVSDTGCGIPTEQQGKLFTKFFRADNAKQLHPDGTGLGLYIVKSVLENSGGLIWFTSKQNKGTTFYVAIPLTGMRARAGEKQLINA